MQSYDARHQSLISEQQSTKVEIYFTIRQSSFNSLSLVVYLQESDQQKKLIIRTKASHKNQERIEFSQTMVIDYYFEIRQKVIVQVMNGYQKLSVIEGTVGEIFNGRSRGVSKQLIFEGKRIGQFILRCEKIEQGNNKYYEFDISATHLDLGFTFLCCGEKAPQFRLYKIKGNDEYLLYQSEVCFGQNPVFRHCRFGQKRLCNNNSKQPLMVRFYSDHRKTSVIGQAKLDLSMLLQGVYAYKLTRKGQKKGDLFFHNFKETIKYQFIDFLKSGMQISQIICIDFTASNGIQNRPDSLHFVGNYYSQYELALSEVSKIVLDYDNDKLVPGFGFGAKVNMPTYNSEGKVDHCFPLNGSTTNPNLFQLQGIIKGYRQALPYLSFSGPTLFAPLLRQAMKVCLSMKENLKQYMVLTILTDGVIHDKEEVKDLLVKSCRLPLSVIIIGIGNNEDWSAMEELDDDECQMTDSMGNRTLRDLVQFVSFSKYNNSVALAKDVLEQLPRQVEQYHALIGVTPQAYKKNLYSDLNEVHKSNY